MKEFLFNRRFFLLNGSFLTGIGLYVKEKGLLCPFLRFGLKL